MSRPLTMADLLAISGYTRDQMRGLLDAMPAFARRNTAARIAKNYSAQDLLLIRTCTQLETRYGLQRGTVANFSDALRSVLTGPRHVSKTASLLLSFDPADVHYLEATGGFEEGLLVPLAPIFQVVDDYLLPGTGQLSWQQHNLGFVPQTVESAATSAPASPPAAPASSATPATSHALASRKRRAQ